jgi:hypothetical protein
MATIKLTRDFREFLQLLESEKIEYLLIGGYAVALYGYARPTKDIDIWIATDPENLKRLKNALIQFGFTAESIPDPLFTSEQTVLRMGVPPTRLEILSAIAGVEFRDCLSRAVVMDVDGLPIRVIHYEDLKRNKMATGRVGDRADIERLEKRRNKGEA